MTGDPIRCVFLDLGKVLVDFSLDPFRIALEKMTGIGVDRLRAALLSDGLPHRYETGLMTDEQFHSEVCRRLQVQMPFEEFAAGWNSIFREAPILPDGWLAAIASRVPIWIVSNTNPLHFEFVRSRYSFLRFVSGCIVSCEVGAAKPDPRIFARALEKAGCEPREAVFVDDQPVNVAAAAQLGMDAIRFTSPEQFESEMRSRGLL